MKDGIIVLNKPQNWTSSDCVAICRRALRCKGIKKVGHGGTLDPMATGVLPIFVGQATRIMEYLELDQKTYRCGARLGTVTDTLDVWGEVLENRSFEGITEDDIREGLKSFEGWIWQKPPKYSAVRINGKRLYEYAYKGQEIDVDIKLRNVNVEKINLIAVDMQKGEFLFDVTCSKGTYIRTICDDLGEKLGCGCIMTSLTRTKVGNIGLDCGLQIMDPLDIKARCVEIADSGAFASESEAYAAQLENTFLLPDYPLVHFGSVEIEVDRAVYFSRGNSLWWNQVQVVSEPDLQYIRSREKDGSVPKNHRGRDYDRIYKVYQKETGEFLGTGYYDKESKLLKADKVFIEKR